MGKASRLKRGRHTPMTAEEVYRRAVEADLRHVQEMERTRNIVWEEIEARVAAHFDEAFHSGGTVNHHRPWGTMPEKHPLRFQSGFRLINFDKRFGDLPVYKTGTKEIGNVMKQANNVPETKVWWGEYQASSTQPPLTMLAWTRKNTIEEIKHAVAFLLMLDRQPVIIRAFGTD